MMRARRAPCGLLMLTALLTAVALSSVAAAAAPESSSDAQPPHHSAEYSAHCAACHGGQLQGGLHAPALTGARFRANWTGKRARLLYSRIISTMPPNDPGTLSPPEVLAITLYVFALNGIEWTGHAPSKPDDLNTLTIP